MSIQYDTLSAAFPDCTITTYIDWATVHQIHLGPTNIVWICTDHSYTAVSGRDWDDYGDPKPCNLSTTWFNMDYTDDKQLTNDVIRHITKLLNQQTRG
jgi:hypothetical protein